MITPKPNEAMSSNEYLARKGLACPYCKTSPVGADGDPQAFGTEATARVSYKKCGRSWNETWVLTGWYADDEDGG